MKTFYTNSLTKVYNSDFRDVELPDGLLITDPPYNVAIKTVVGRGKVKHREFAQASGEMSRPHYHDKDRLVAVI